MKSIFEMNEKEQELNRLLNEANQAKEILRRVSDKLAAAGYMRKSKSCYSLIINIEEWQNRR